MSPLSDSEKVDVRRHCGYPVYGAAPTAMESWRFFQAYGLLEYRLANLADAETAVVRRYLATLSALELAVPAASESLDTQQAANWTRNQSEVTERLGLLDEWRRRLCGFLGVPCGPALFNGSPTLVV